VLLRPLPVVIDPGSNPWDNREAALLYDRIYSGGDVIPLFLDLAAAAGGPVLEIGCGTGRCLIPFIRTGFDTVGLDRSDAMLAILRQKLKSEQDDVFHRATALREDGRDFEIPLRFGMAFIGRNSYGHFLSREEQERFATNVYQHLRPGGLLVIDMFNPDLGRLLNPKPEVFEDGEILVRDEVMRSDLAEQALSMETTIERKGQTIARVAWRLRFSYRFELELLLEKCGFEVVSLWGDYHRTDFAHGAERICVVARKPPDADMTVVRFMRAAVAETV